MVLDAGRRADWVLMAMEWVAVAATKPIPRSNTPTTHHCRGLPPDTQRRPPGLTPPLQDEAQVALAHLDWWGRGKIGLGC